MSQFGGTLFGDSRFIRWTLSPFILLFAVAIPFLIDEWTVARTAVMAGMEFVCAALLAGFWLPARIGRWAFRGVAGAVFIAYAAYLIHEFFFTDTPFRLAESRSHASPRNALLGFVIIGLPSLWYALLGRFSLRAPPPEGEIAEPGSE